MSTVTPLPKAIHDEVMELGKPFKIAKNAGDLAGAEPYLLQMWQMFPEPKFNWDWSQSYLTSIAGFYFEWKRFAEAEHWAREVFKCEPLPNDPGPYILLGKIYLEWGKQDLAAENLVKAFDMGGRRGFAGEDPKYLKFAQAQMKK